MTDSVAIIKQSGDIAINIMGAYISPQRDFLSNNHYVLRVLFSFFFLKFLLNLKHDAKKYNIQNTGKTAVKKNQYRKFLHINTVSCALFIQICFYRAVDMQTIA